MKIGLDLRFIKDNLYSTFVIELVKGLISTESNNEYIIYTNNYLEGFNFPNLIIKKVGIKNLSIKEQTTYLKILKKDRNNLMIFFNPYKPIFYLGTYFTLIPSLKEVYYSNFSNYFQKYSYMYLLEKNLKRSAKIICFDRNTNDELVEKFNINENKINYLKGFFPNRDSLSNTFDLDLNIRIKYNIKNDFIIYSGGEGVEKNYDKLVHLFKRLKKDGIDIDLVFLGDAISKNITLRDEILKLNIQNNIHFIGVIKPAEKYIFYKDSIGIIFPSFYEPFPFRLTEPLYFDTPIISSDLENIKNVFGDSINYFSPLSVNSIYEKMKSILKENKVTVNYEEIKKKYTTENTISELLEIMK